MSHESTHSNVPPHANRFFPLVALIFQNTLMVICLKLTFKNGASTYAPSTVVLVTEVIKLLVCGTALRSFHELQRCMLQINRQRLLLLPSILYVIQNNLLFYGAERLPSLIYIICSQLKVLTTAIMSGLILGTRLKRDQYFYLILLILGIVLVQAQSEMTHPQFRGVSHARSVLGVLAMVLASWTSGTAGVILEKIFKMSPSSSVGSGHTIWTRNVQLSIISLPFAFFRCIHSGS